MIEASRSRRCRLLTRVRPTTPPAHIESLARVARLILLGLATLTCAPRLVHAAALLVLPASGENVSAAFVEQAHHQLVSSLAGVVRGQIPILAPDGHAVAKPLEPAHAIQRARELGTDVALTLHIAHASDATLLVLTGYSIGGAPPVQILRRLTVGPEFLPETIHDMAVAFLSESGPPFSDPIPRAQAMPAPPPRQTFVGMGVGFMTALNTAGGETKWLGSTAVFVMKVMPTTLVDARLEYSSLGSASVLGLGAGAAWLPAGRGVYVGAGAKWSKLTLGGQGANGIAVQPTVGFLHRFGTSPIFRAEMSYVLNLFDESEPDRLIPGAGDGHFAHGPLTNIGVAF